VLIARRHFANSVVTRTVASTIFALMTGDSAPFALSAPLDFHYLNVAYQGQTAVQFTARRTWRTAEGGRTPVRRPTLADHADRPLRTLRQVLFNVSSRADCGPWRRRVAILRLPTSANSQPRPIVVAPATVSAGASIESLRTFNWYNGARPGLVLRLSDHIALDRGDATRQLPHPFNMPDGPGAFRRLRIP